MPLSTHALFYAALLALSCSGSATAQSFTGPKNLSGIDINDGDLVIRLTSNTFCGSPIVTVSRNQISYQEMVATAMTALLTGRPVDVYISACNPTASVARMSLGTVY